MHRVVLDTNILVAGLASRRGASFAVLQLVAARRIRPLVSVALFLEYEAVLKRGVQQRRHGFSEEQIDRFMTEFAALAEPIDVHFRWRPQLADVDDEMVLETIVNGRGDVLVTHNVRHFVPAATRFAVTVMRPGNFLEGIER